MKKNIATKDRLIRFIVFIVFGVLMLNIYNDLLLEFLTGFIGIYCFFSAVFEFCILYHVLGVSTRASNKKRIY